MAQGPSPLTEYTAFPGNRTFYNPDPDFTGPLFQLSPAARD